MSLSPQNTNMLADNYFAVLALDLDNARSPSSDSSNTMPSATDSTATNDFTREARDMLIQNGWLSVETDQGDRNALGLYSNASPYLDAARARMPPDEAPFASRPVGSFLCTSFDPRLKKDAPAHASPHEIIPARLGTPVPDAPDAPQLTHAEFEALTANDHMTAWNTQLNRAFRLVYDEVKAICMTWYDTPSYVAMRNQERRNARMPAWAMHHYTALRLGRIITVNAGNACGLDYKFEVLGPEGGAIWLRDEMVDIIPGMLQEIDRFWDAGFALRSDLAERLLRWRPARYSSDWWTAALEEWSMESNWTTHVYLRGEDGSITNIYGPCYHFY